ncbi:MAG: methionyl-tRNA formyltransferase [Treponema sp.]|jgi:methionyl-tRNA formyltransferase|nr:methionyl-tRNA formyltransferase [Treponema sp.]
MRIIFAGSPAIAVPALEALAVLALENAEQGGAPVPPAGSFELAGILSNPDSPRGRHGKPEPTEVAAAAAALGSRFEGAGRKPPFLMKPERLGSEIRGKIEALGPDILVSFAYGRIFGPKFLALFPLGGINIHPSLLPAYRGPAPIPQAILNRDRETGISVQRLALEMDCGDILVQEAFPLDGTETTAGLSGEMARRAAVLIPQVLRGIAAGTMEGRPQDGEKASYCRLLSREDGRIDWGRGAFDIEARIRAYTPWPLSWTMDGDQRLYINKALAGPAGTAAPGTVLGIDRERGILVQTGEGTLAVSALQYGGKKALDWKAFLNGARGFIGRRLG